MANITWHPPLAAPQNLQLQQIAGSLPADTYYVVVIAMNTTCTAANIRSSPPCSEVNIVLAAPGGIQCDWDVVAGATHYLVFYRKSAENWYGIRCANGQVRGLTVNAFDIVADGRDSYNNRTIGVFCENPAHFPSTINNTSGIGYVEISGSGTVYLKDISDVIANTNFCNYVGSQTNGGMFYLMGTIMFASGSTAVLEMSNSQSVWLFGGISSSSTATVLFGEKAEGRGGVFYAARYLKVCSFFSNDKVYNSYFQDWGIRHFTDGLQGGEKYGHISGCVFSGSQINGITFHIYAAPTIQYCLLGGVVRIHYDMTAYEINNLTFLRSGYLGSSDAKIYVSDIIWVDVSSWDVIIQGNSDNTKEVHLRNQDNQRSGRTENKPRIYWFNMTSAEQRNCFIEYTVNIEVTDSNGNPINEATVKMYDKDNNLIFEKITGIDGKIDTLTVEALRMTNKYTGYNIDDANYSKSIITYKTPHTMIIEKSGYYLYKSKFDLTQKIDCTIALPPAETEAPATPTGLVVDTPPGRPTGLGIEDPDPAPARPSGLIIEEV